MAWWSNSTAVTTRLQNYMNYRISLCALRHRQTKYLTLLPLQLSSVYKWGRLCWNAWLGLAGTQIGIADDGSEWLMMADSFLIFRCNEVCGEAPSGGSCKDPTAAQPLGALWPQWKTGWGSGLGVLVLPWMVWVFLSVIFSIFPLPLWHQIHWSQCNFWGLSYKISSKHSRMQNYGEL